MKFVHQLFEERPSVLITCAVAAPGLEQPFTWHLALSVPPAAMNFLCKPSILYLIIMLHFFNAGRRFDPPVVARPVDILHDGAVVVVWR